MNVGANTRFARRNNICEICIWSFVIQSEARNLFSFPSRDSSRCSEWQRVAFGFRVPRITINHWQLTINLSFRASAKNLLSLPRGIPHYVRNDKGGGRMTNTVICVDSRHLRNLRSDIADTTQKKGEHWGSPLLPSPVIQSVSEESLSVTFGLTQK